MPQSAPGLLSSAPSTGLPPFLRRGRSPSPSPGGGFRTCRAGSPSNCIPRLQSARRLLDGNVPNEEIQGIVEEFLFESIPRGNVIGLQVTQLRSEPLRRRFLQGVRADGGRWSRARVAWHFPGSAPALSAIMEHGICCDEDHCACGRYGRGGYVALSAAKANAYAYSDGEGGTRHLFLVLAFPEEDVVQGERGLRPARTAADLPSHPTEYCFVDASRLYCACLLTYHWVPTGRREKVTTTGCRVSHFVPPRRNNTSPKSSTRGRVSCNFGGA